MAVSKRSRDMRSRFLLLGMSVTVLATAGCSGPGASASWVDVADLRVEGFLSIQCDDGMFPSGTAALCFEDPGDDAAAAMEEFVEVLESVGVVFREPPDCHLAVGGTTACSSNGALRDGTIAVTVLPMMGDAGVFKGLSISVFTTTSPSESPGAP